MPLKHRTLYIIEFNRATSVFNSDMYESAEYEFEISDRAADAFDLSEDPYIKFASSIDRPTQKTSLGAVKICNEMGFSAFDIEPTRGKKANVSNGKYEDAINKLAEFLENNNGIQIARLYTESSTNDHYEIAEALANHKGFPDLLLYDEEPPNEPKFLAEIKLGNDNIIDSQQKFFEYFYDHLPIAKISINSGIKIDTEPEFESHPHKIGRCPECQSLTTTVDSKLKNRDMLGFECSTCSNRFLACDQIPIIECGLCGGEHVADQGIEYESGTAYCNDTGDYFSGEVKLRDPDPRYGY